MPSRPRPCTSSIAKSLEGWWTYYARTRDKSPSGYERFKRGRLSAIATLDCLAELETLVGTKRTHTFLEKALAKARAEAETSK